MRPFTLIGAGIAGFCIVAIYSAYYNLAFDLKPAFLAGLILAMLQGSGQAFNQSLVEEIEIDRLNGKTYRPCVQGIISPFEGKVFAVALALIAITLALSINPLFGLLCFVLALFAIFYTAPPLRVKRRFLLNNLWQGIARGFLPWIAVWSLSPKIFDSLPLALGLVLGTWVTAFQSTKDFGGDEVGDRIYGVKTLPVVLGKRSAIKMMKAIASLSFLLLIAFISIGILPRELILLLVLIVPSWFILKELERERPRKIAILENQVAWGAFYITLGLFYIIPMVVLCQLGINI
jgi:4-hydroxybenzoate polyprenyltransferase